MYQKDSLKIGVASMLAVVLILAVVPPLQATACWTVMVYLDGDNDLESAGIDDFNEMEAVGSTTNVNIVVQFDRRAGYDNSNGDWTGAKRFSVINDANGYDNTIVSPVISDLGEVNMGDPNELISFINWAKTDYPADYYLLVLWDHGSGWKFISESVKAVCFDDTSADSLSIGEVRTALESVTCSSSCPLDIVGFDACYMGMVEIDYEILPYAHYRVGSEEYEPGDGWDYVGFLSYMVQNPSASPADVAKKIVETYINYYGTHGKPTQSAVHLNPTGTVVEALDVFAFHLAGAMQYRTEIGNARSQVEYFSDLDYIDLYHFAELVRTYVPDRGIQKDASTLMRAIDEAVIAEGHGGMHPNAHGIAVYFPSTSAGYLSRYETDVELAEDTYWDEFLKQYYNPVYPLDAVITAAPAAVHSGDVVTVSMTVTNLDDHTIVGVAPSPLTVVGTATAYAVLSSGPLPVSADLVAGDSATFVWTYQVFAGVTGGVITFVGDACGTDSASGNKVFSPLVTSNPVVIPGLNLVTEPVPNYNEQMQPVASHRIQVVEAALRSLQQRFAAAQTQGKDTTPCQALLDLVEEYLEKAKENFEKGNYIAANYWALQATAALEEAEECLENL